MGDGTGQGLGIECGVSFSWKEQTQQAFRDMSLCKSDELFCIFETLVVSNMENETVLNSE